MSTFGPNPPWVDAVFSTGWDRISSAVGKAKMPRVASRGRTKIHVEEYGCGHYGCVMPTETEGLVIKLTSDPAEAAFVQWAIGLGDQPTGLVKYHAVLAVPGERRGRPMFLIWRDEAEAVGLVKLIHVLGHAAGLKLSQRLNLIQTHAGKARAILERSSDRAKLREDADRRMGWAMDMVGSLRGAVPQHRTGADAFALHLAAYKYRVEEASQTQGIYAIGEAMWFYYMQNVVLADVHGGNVGLSLERGDREPIIVDPGHAFSIDASLDEVSIPALA